MFTEGYFALQCKSGNAGEFRWQSDQQAECTPAEEKAKGPAAEPGLCMWRF